MSNNNSKPQQPSGDEEVKNWFVGLKPNRTVSDLSRAGLQVVSTAFFQMKGTSFKAEVRGSETSIKQAYEGELLHFYEPKEEYCIGVQ